VEFEFDGIRQRHFFSSRFMPEVEADGRVEHVLTVAHDRTTEHKALLALREADRRKDEFLATLAHELRNPLAPLRNGLSVLQRSAGADQTERIRGMMERQLEHMVRLVDDLLDVSRVTTGKVILRMEAMTLQSAALFAVEASRPLLDAARHQFELDLPSDDLWVNGDPTRLAQVITNLLANACKYTPTGGWVTLKARRDGAEAVLQVCDSGIGIPAEHLPYVFDMFSQASASIDRAQGGLGIGLALVRALLALHGGEVLAESGGKLLGSTFTVRLPLTAGPTAEAASVAAGSQSGTSPPRRILAVDDNKDAVQSLAEMLELAGHEVAVAYGGSSALQLMGGFAPEVVLLDIGMFDLDGHEVARRIREVPEFAEIRLVALTGWGTEEDKARATAAGFDFHLTKPVSLVALQGVLNGRLDRKAAS
jgi:signal transduction histidine kinase/ActR/RegA family two-component response regulator